MGIFFFSFFFYSSCGMPSHLPAICSVSKLWVKKCADDSETANWISANTKECPKCHSTIEKNGGCNHMNCKASVLPHFLSFNFSSSNLPSPAEMQE